MSEQDTTRRTEPEDDTPSGRPLGRRQFITGGLAAGAATILVPKLVRSLVLPNQRVFVPSNNPTMTRWLRRRDDFMTLYFEFYNLRLSSDGTSLVRNSPTQEAVVVVRFTGQHILEQAFKIEDAAPISVDPPPIGARATKPLYTRLAFRIPSDIESIPFSSDALLAWDDWAQSVVPVAKAVVSPSLPSSPPALMEPSTKQTAIEAPWWLVLSPSDRARWTHKAKPRTSNVGRTEIWHTKLDSSPSRVGPSGPEAGSKVRAVWARDPEFQSYAKTFNELRSEAPDVDNASWPSEDFPFVASLTAKNRAEIVVNSSGFMSGFVPEAIDSRLLLLSAVGASLDVAGDWPDPKNPKTSLLEWDHQATGGRDHWVRLVHEGYLFPFGHRARLVTITERRTIPLPTDSTQPAAYLLKRTFIIVKQPEKSYPVDVPGMAQPDGGRGLPFRRVRVLTRITPNFTKRAIDGFAAEQAFVPFLGGAPLRFDLVGVDHAGSEIAFSSPLAFVIGGTARSPVSMGALVDKYNQGLTIGGHNINDEVGIGSLVAYAQPTTPGSTTAETVWVMFGAQKPPTNVPSNISDTLEELGLPAFWPSMRTAGIRPGAAEQVTGAAAGGVARFFYHDKYVKNDFGAGEVFLAADAQQESLLGVTFNEGRGGGIATPNFTVDGLSRKLGFVADRGNIDANKFVPASFLKNAGLLGGASLSDILPAEIPHLNSTPRLQQELVGDPLAPDKVITRLAWSTADLKDHGVFKGTGGTLDLQAEYVTDAKNPAASTSKVVGELRDVALQFGLTADTEFLRLRLARVRFTQAQGGKPDVRLDIRGVELLGPLEFVQDFQNFLGPVLEAGGAPSGPSVDVTPIAVLATYTVAIPAMEVGAFNLQNVSVTSGINLPLDGGESRSIVRFSTRDDPFLLTVMGLGGGGYFMFRGGLDGVEELEASLEFGAAVALNLGVAKGKAKATGGISFKYDFGTDEAIFAGFLKMGGSLRVLGLVTVSANFHLKLAYETATKKAVGTAKLEVEIDLGLFSKSVTLKVQRKIGKGDPSFGALYPPNDETCLEPGADPCESSQWNRYCAAFSGEAT